jgi:hypothetical protein
MMALIIIGILWLFACGVVGEHRQQKACRLRPIFLHIAVFLTAVRQVVDRTQVVALTRELATGETETTIFCPSL